LVGVLLYKVMYVVLYVLYMT